MVDHVVHLEQQKLTLYRGGYSAFERTRAERLAQQQQAYEKQQAQRAHMEDFIRRFKAKASKARQAQSRIKALERLEELAPAHIDSPFDFVFREADKVSSPLLNLSEAAPGLRREERAGQGQAAAGSRRADRPARPQRRRQVDPDQDPGWRTQPLGGRLTRGENLAVGYFAQHQLDSLHPKASPLLHLQRIAPAEREQTLRDFLGGFDFRGPRCDEPVLNFSGGEKARLALALIAWQKPNLLLLDEPTNHLDLEMRLALTLALQDFEGAVLVVSHDRHLLKSTTDAFLLVADGRVQAFDGDLDDYGRWLVDYRARQQPASEAPANADKTDKRAQRQAAAALRQQLAPRKKAADKLEKELGAVHGQLAALEARLGDSAPATRRRARTSCAALLAEQAALKGPRGRAGGGLAAGAGRHWKPWKPSWVARHEGLAGPVAGRPGAKPCCSAGNAADPDRRLRVPAASGGPRPDPPGDPLPAARRAAAAAARRSALADHGQRADAGAGAASVCPPACCGRPSPASPRSPRWPSSRSGACCRTCSARC